MREIDQPGVQQRIYDITVSRTRHAGMSEQAGEVAQEVIAFRRAVKEQREYFKENGEFHPGKLPALSPLAERVNFLDHLARFGEKRREAMERRYLAKLTSPKSI